MNNLKIHKYLIDIIKFDIENVVISKTYSYEDNDEHKIILKSCYEILAKFVSNN